MCKIVNAYIVSELYHWPINPTNNFKFKNCLFGATSIIKNSDKGKYVYSGYEIIFNSAGSLSFDNYYVRNVIICGVDNIWSSHADHCKNNFLIIAEGHFFSPEKN